jgi:hypothetical protein
LSITVFSGPTLSTQQIEAELEGARCPGPAARGDVYRAHSSGSKVIVIIDGYFEHQLAIWHKEILWVLSQGALVYGAASMGALRAVELAAFGMIGVGRVYEWFRDGFLEDDDEVALVHAPAEQQHKPISEALVNIRATLDRACKLGVVTPVNAEAMVQLAKRQFYPLRSYRSLLEACRADEGLAREAARLDAWLQSTTSKVDQKLSDALELLRRVRDDLANQSKPPLPLFRFEYTEAWHEFVRHMQHDAEP